ncbi:GIY-YIG nuclease family protein [uncultured Winogradskyella sp.]|nr:GIY-YIG nuclease family protein [uncultured Winogradskyella sp.]
MPKGYTDILECSNKSYYVGSTIDLALRFMQHQKGEGLITPKNIFLLS